MSSRIMKTIGVGALVLAFTLPLGACSDNAAPTAEKGTEEKQKELPDAQKQIANEIKLKKEALDAEKDRLVQQAKDNFAAVKKDIEARIADLDRQKDALKDRADTEKERLLKEIEESKAELMKEIDLLNRTKQSFEDQVKQQGAAADAPKEEVNPKAGKANGQEKAKPGEGNGSSPDPETPEKTKETTTL